MPSPSPNMWLFVVIFGILDLELSTLKYVGGLAVAFEAPGCSSEPLDLISISELLSSVSPRSPCSIAWGFKRDPENFSNVYPRCLTFTRDTKCEGHSAGAFEQHYIIPHLLPEPFAISPAIFCRISIQQNDFSNLVLLFVLMEHSLLPTLCCALSTAHC